MGTQRVLIQQKEEKLSKKEGGGVTGELICCRLAAEAKVSQAACSSGRPEVTGAPKKSPKWRGGVLGGEGGAALSVYPSETAAPGSYFGSQISQRAPTFSLYAQLS